MLLDFEIPLVSIGLPVFDGQRYICYALDAILDQSFIDFELIICDNGSTDQTDAICRKYLRRGDKRIRYYRSKKNLGAAWNFNRAFKLSRGKYFKWASYDDVIAHTFLERCVDTLESNSDVVLCHSYVQAIGEDGYLANVQLRQGEKSKEFLEKVGSIKPSLRFSEAIQTDRGCVDIFGLLRSDALKHTALIGSYAGSDLNLLAELSLLGRFCIIPEVLFYHRKHRGRSIKIQDRKELEYWFDTRKRKRWVFPYWKNLLEFMKTVGESDVGFWDKAFCYHHLLKWALKYRHRLIQDFKCVAEDLSPAWVVHLYRGLKAFAGFGVILLRRKN